MYSSIIVPLVICINRQKKWSVLVGWYGCLVASWACNQVYPGWESIFFFHSLFLCMNVLSFFLPGLSILSTGTGRLATAYNSTYTYSMARNRASACWSEKRDT